MLYLVGASLTLLLIGTSEFVQGEDDWKCNDYTCYLFHDQLMNYDEAKQLCADKSSHLVIIEDASEDAYVRGIANQLQGWNYWLGGNDQETEGTWVWLNRKSIRTTGTNGTYANWERHQPDDYRDNEDCMGIYKRYNYQWNDMPCDYVAFPICEQY